MVTYAPRYTVMGCEGDDATHINGVYTITRHWGDHRPVYVKLGRGKLWLMFKQKEQIAEKEQQEQTDQGAATGNWYICDSIDENGHGIIKTERKFCSKTEEICGEWSVPGLLVTAVHSDELLVWLLSFISFMKIQI